MNNRHKDWKAFVRSTSNVMSTTNHYQINLPPHVIRKMGWKLNEKVRIKTIKGQTELRHGRFDVQNYIMIEKDLEE